MFQALICGNSLLILIHHYLICTCFSEFSLLRSLRSVGGVEYIMLRTLQIFDLWNRLLHVPAGASKSWEAVITATRKELKTQSLRTLSSLAGPFHGPARSLGAQPPVREHFFQFAHISLLFFGDCTLERHLHQFLRFFAEFLAVNFAQASNFCFQSGFLFSSSAYLSAASTSDRSACWWRMASRRSLRRLISFFRLLSCDGFW